MSASDDGTVDATVADVAALLGVEWGLARGFVLVLASRGLATRVGFARAAGRAGGRSRAVWRFPSTVVLDLDGLRGG